jgi:Fe-S-cluster containining protein
MTKPLEATISKAKAEQLELEDKFRRKVQNLQLQSKKAVTCFKGCSHCCYYPVHISLLEGIQLYSWLRGQGLWVSSLRAKFQEASTKTWNLPLEVWFLSRIPCPLLKEDQCQAYPGRPLVCRLTLSTGDPYYCHPHRMGSATGFVDRRPEMDEHTKSHMGKLKSHQQRSGLLPLATAVLYGERICNGELEIVDADQELLTEHRKKG